MGKGTDLMIETSSEHEIYSYEPFTQHAFYREVNQGLVRQALAHLPATAHDQPLCIVDLACGTGAMSELVLQELPCLGRSAHLIGIDSSAEALERAASRLAGAAVTFVEGDRPSKQEKVTLRQ